MQTSNVKIQRKRKRDSIHHSLPWYCILALATIGGSKHSQHNGLPCASALSHPNSRTTKYAFFINNKERKRISVLANLRGGGDENSKNNDKDDDVMSMDDSELDAYIDFLLAESQENPFESSPKQEVAATSEPQQEQPTTDDSLVDLPEIDNSQQEEENDSVQPIQTEHVQEEMDTSTTTESMETEAVVEEETNAVDTSTTESMETEAAVEETNIAVTSSEEVEISEPSMSEGVEPEKISSSEVVIDDELIPQSKEEDLVPDASAEEKITDSVDESSETDKKQETTSRRPSLWGRLYKPAQSEEKIVEEVTKEEAHAEVSIDVATESIETEAAEEETNIAVTSSEEVEISETSMSEDAEPDGEGISSEVVIDDAVIPQSKEEDLVPDASAEEKSTDNADESSETDKKQETTSRRPSLWGRLYKPAQSEEKVVEEVTKEEAQAEVSIDVAAEDVEEESEEGVPVSSEDTTESRPSLKERCNDQWQKMKSIMGTKESNDATKEEVDDELVAPEPQRDYSEIYQKYYSEEESSTETTDSSEINTSSKSAPPPPRRFAFFSKKSTDEDAPVDSSMAELDSCTASSEPMVDMETSTLESEKPSLVEQEPAIIERKVLSLDRTEEVSHDSGQDISSSDETPEQLDELLDVDTTSGTSHTTESSEQNQDAVFLSLDIPDTEDIEEIDEEPVLEEAEEETDTQEPIPIVEDMKENEDESPIEEDQVEHDSRVLLSLDIPSVEEPEEHSDKQDELGETSHDTDDLSVNMIISEDSEADLPFESEDDETSSTVGRFVLSLDRPAYTIELDEEGSGQSVGETSVLEDCSEVADEIVSSEYDDATEIDLDAVETDIELGAFDVHFPNESLEDDDEGNLDDANELSVESLDSFDLDDSVEEDGSKVSKSEDKGLESTVKKLSIVDRSLLVLLMLSIMLEEMLKLYILPVFEELVDWAFGKKPPPLFRDDFSLRKFLGLRGGAAKTTKLGSAKVKSGDESGDELNGEDSDEGSDSHAENHKTETKEDEPTNTSAQQSLSTPRVRPNFIYRYLLGCGRAGHSIIMVSVFSIEWVQIYLPAVAFLAANVRRQVLGERTGFRYSEESFAAQTTGFVDGTGSTVRGAKKKKAQTQKDDQQALDQLNRLGDANQARYYFVSDAFLKRHAIGPYSSASPAIVVGTKVTVDESDEESEEDWVVEALTRKEVSTEESVSEPSVDVSIGSSGSALSVGIDFGFGEKTKKSTKRASISEVAISSASSRSTKSRKPRVQRVSDRESGVMGRIRAAGANSLVGRSILGAYPGDVPPPDEASDPNGLLVLASKYGYGDWSDVDWSDQDDSEFGSRRRKSRKKRRSVPGSERKEKGTLEGLDLGEIVRDTQSSKTRRTRSASSRPRNNDETAASATQTVKKTRIRRKKKLQPTSTLKKTNAQKDSVKSTVGSKILKTDNATTSGSTVAGPAIESMKETAKLEENTKPQTDATPSSASGKVIGKAHSSTVTQSSGALKKSNAQKHIVKSTRESKVLNTESTSTTGSAVAGSAMQSLLKAAKSKADVTDDSSSDKKAKPGPSSTSSSVVGPAISSIKESAAKEKSGVANSAIEALKKKAKEKSKSSILDPKEE